MARRMLDSSMWQNEKFAELPMGGRLLLIGIINLADDQGRVKGNPAYLRAQIFPYDDLSAAEIQTWLETIRNHDTILLYTVDGKQYLQLINWWDYQSLQYAQPSEYPRPEGWQDRIRRTFTKGEIVTCNWFRVNGEPIPDTCDMDGKPITRRATKEKKPPESSPKQDQRQAKPLLVDSPEYSPECSPNHSGESTPEDTILTKDHDQEEDHRERVDQGYTARETVNESAAALSPKFAPPKIPLVPHKPRMQDSGTSSKPAQPPVKVNGPYLDGQRFQNGRIPANEGRNAVEVFYERYSIRDCKLSEPLEDDIARAVTDLDLWRSVVTDWQQHGYKPLNIRGQLEWYANGGKPNATANSNSRSNGFGIVGRGAEDKQRAAANQPTAEEIERVRAERRAAQAAGLTIQQWKQQQQILPA